MCHGIGFRWIDRHDTFEDARSVQISIKSVVNEIRWDRCYLHHPFVVVTAFRLTKGYVYPGPLLVNAVKNWRSVIVTTIYVSTMVAGRQIRCGGPMSAFLSPCKNKSFPSIADAVAPMGLDP